MKRTDYISLTAIGFIFLFALSMGISSLYESYLEGRIINGAGSSNTSVLIGNNSCYTSIYDDTINFTCGGTIEGLNNYYAGVFYHNHTATSLSFDEEDVYYTLFMTNSTNLNGFTVEGLGFGLETNLTCLVSGIYKADYMAIGSGINNHIYTTSIFVNEVNKLECEAHHKLSATGDILTQTGLCIITINEGDKVSVRTSDMTSSSTGKYYGSNINLIRIGNI